jgi:uncharacterized protein involved in exopolysaccharide biosynthesis
MENKLYDDELNLFEYLRLIIKYKRFLMFFMILFVVFGLLYSIFAEKQYKVATTFFLPLDSKSSSSGLMNYAVAFGAVIPSNLDDYLIFIIKSARIQRAVFKDVYFKLYPNENKFNIDKVKILNNKINLSDSIKIIKDKSGIFTLKCINSDPVLAYDIINFYLKNIVEINKELNITATKKIITILDEPILPKQPFRPRKKIVLLGSFVSAFIIGFVFILFFNYIKTNMKHLKN